MGYVPVQFGVSAQEIRRTGGPELVAGSVGIFRAEFLFDQLWDDFYDRVAVFCCGDVQRECVLDGADICTIPWEVLQPGNDLRVGVYGLNEGRCLPTVWSAPLSVRPGVLSGPKAAEDI